MSQKGIFTQLWPLIKYVYHNKTYFFLLYYQTWICWLAFNGKIICRFKTCNFGYFQTRFANSGQCAMDSLQKHKLTGSSLRWHLRWRCHTTPLRIPKGYDSTVHPEMALQVVFASMATPLYFRTLTNPSE